MNLASLLALLAITLTDPTGDAIGDGTLDPPTSPIYANVAMFDLQTVQLEVSDTGEGVLTVTLGALGSLVPEGLPAGADEDGAGAEEPTGGELQAADPAEGAIESVAEFDISALLAVVDVYLDTGVGGADQTLSGPNMLLPAGAGWHHAVRISAEGAWGITYVGAAQPEPGAAVPAPEPMDPAELLQPEPGASGEDPVGLETLSDSEAGEPQTLAYVPLAVSRAGNALSMTLPWMFEPEAPIDVYAVTGVHDPFSPDGWRGVSQTSSPWAFSGGEQVVPVIDLLAADAEAQAAALRSGVLPAPERASGMTLPLSPWLWLMVAGLALALFGLVLRGRVGAPAAKPAADDGAPAGADSAVAVDAAPASDDDSVVNDHVSTAVDETEPEDEPTEPVPDEWDQVELVTGTDSGTAVVAAGLDGAASAATDPLTGAGSELDADVDVDVAGTLLAFDLGDDEVELGAAQPAVGDNELDGADGPTGADALRTSTDRSAFSTAVDETYLTLDGEAGGGLFGDDVAGGESFWHPGSRLKNSSASLRNVAEEHGASAGTRDESASGGEGNTALVDGANHERDDEEA